jgi:hypothetical protein
MHQLEELLGDLFRTMDADIQMLTTLYHLFHQQVPAVEKFFRQATFIRTQAHQVRDVLLQLAQVRVENVALSEELNELTSKKQQAMERIVELEAMLKQEGIAVVEEFFGDQLDYLVRMERLGHFPHTYRFVLI